MSSRSALAAGLMALSALWPATASPTGRDGTQTLRVTVVGGSHAGTWQARTTLGGCTSGVTRPGEWADRYAVDDRDIRKLTSLQIFVPDAKGAAAGTREFSLSIAFGPLARPSAQYDVETRSSSRRRHGNGFVTVAERGAGAQVTFAATTVGGVKISGVVDCSAVVRAPSA